jgi:hypothetical protein
VHDAGAGLGLVLAYGMDWMRGVAVVGGYRALGRAGNAGAEEATAAHIMQNLKTNVPELQAEVLAAEREQFLEGIGQGLQVVRNDVTRLGNALFEAVTSIPAVLQKARERTETVAQQ